jgi:hypothetical protein
MPMIDQNRFHVGSMRMYFRIERKLQAAKALKKAGRRVRRPARHQREETPAN